ncbi:MAG TPA: TolC family protein [Gemmataceae bacterium]|nr:TolC family protein [Gemmataceae bacterium]
MTQSIPRPIVATLALLLLAGVAADLCAQENAVQHPPLRLADAVPRSLANVQTVQANVAVQAATVARFEALKAFVPLMTLPQTVTGLRNYDTTPGSLAIYPDITVAPFTGIPGDHIMLNRMFLSLPIDPSGQITALPIAEEGIHAKLLMEQLVRRSQAMLAIQGYFEAKQIQYGIRTAQLAATFADEMLALTQRKLLQRQAFDVEVSRARVEDSKAHVFLADLEKTSRILQRRLAVVLHQSRLLVPQTEPVPIVFDHDYCFDLGDPDLVDLRVVPDFPTCREEVIEMAKRQRVEVRLLVVGLRIAQLRRKGSLLGLLGKGALPGEFSYKNATAGPDGGVAMGAIFGATYNAPVLDIGLWTNIRKARLDVVQSQLDLEKALLDVASDAGDSWDRWQQAIKEWEQKEAELRLRHELLGRQERLYQQKQSIWVEVLAAQVSLLQADANRWTAWYNLQLARLDVLRVTELLLDYVEKAKIADLTAWQQPPPESFWHRWLPWLAKKQSVQPPPK